MRTKEFQTKVKAAGEADGLAEGQFRAVVSVFDNVDSMGDVVAPGAFTDSLKEWGDSNDPLPVIWAHDWADPFSHIGWVLDAKETPTGLEVLAELDLENSKAQQVYRLLKGRRVKQFSFAYDVRDSGWVEKDGQEVLELRKLHIFEVGPCLVGANQSTELLAVKARQLAGTAKQGVTLSEDDLELVVAARDALQDILDAGEQVEDDEETPATETSDSESEKTSETSQVGPSGGEDETANGKSAPTDGYTPRRSLAVALLATLD